MLVRIFLEVLTPKPLLLVLVMSFFVVSVPSRVGCVFVDISASLGCLSGSTWTEEKKPGVGGSTLGEVSGRDRLS